MRFRHEYKYIINYADYVSIKHRLKSIIHPDKHSNEGSYIIRSLYFDNVYDKALNEKLDGLCTREKFRIRFYNNNSDFIKLEKKSKISSLCNKITARISKEEVESVIRGDYSVLKESDNELKLELYSKIYYQQLRPKTIVEYNREAFVFDAGNVRITLDSKVRSGIASVDFFNKDIPIFASPQIILEVKYDEFLPEIIANAIKVHHNGSAGSFSKYVVCRV